MIIKMTDGAQTVQVDEAQRVHMEQQGFTQVGAPSELAPGQLVGHGIRVHHEEEAPLPPDHQPQMVQATDGHQTVWVDAAHTARFATFLKRGFVPIPPMPAVEKLESESDAEFATRMNEAFIAYNAQVEQLRQEARTKNGMS
jgi:uncharacterized glyoxalase superfamily metalloenzyme YdcJ